MTEIWKDSSGHWNTEPGDSSVPYTLYSFVSEGTPVSFRIRANTAAATYRAAHPERVKASLAKHRASERYKTYKRRSQVKRYGLTLAAYDALLAAQGGVCAICEEPPRVERVNGCGDRLRSLAVDHDHLTGEVRGLLCMRCNTRLEFVEDFGLRAVAYLQRSRRRRREAGAA